MKPHHRLLSLERLEDRLALASLAELAGPLPDLAMSTAADMAPLAETEGYAVTTPDHNVTLSIEQSAAGNTLRVQFTQLAAPRLVAIAGGSAVWTNADGLAQLSLPLYQQRIELLISSDRLDELTPFLRIEFDQNGRIAHFESLASPGSEMPDSNMAGMALGMPHMFDAFHTSGEALREPALSSAAGSSSAHHANDSVNVLAAGAPFGSTLSSHNSGGHDVERPMTADMSSSSVSVLEMATTPTNSMAFEAELREAGADHPSEAGESPWLMETGESELAASTLDALIAGWTGAEQTEALEQATPLPVASSLTQHREETVAETVTLPVATVAIVSHQVQHASTPGPELSASNWPAISASLVAAVSAAGVVLLERQAMQAAANRGRPKSAPPVHQAGGLLALPVLKVAG